MVSIGILIKFKGAYKIFKSLFLLLDPRIESSTILTIIPLKYYLLVSSHTRTWNLILIFIMKCY